MMNESFERGLGRLEGRMDSVVSKIDALITQIASNEVRTEKSREMINLRLDEAEEGQHGIKEELHKVKNELHVAALKLTSQDAQLAAIEPEIAAMREMRVKAATVVGLLTLLGAFFGVSLFQAKDWLFKFLGIDGGS